MVRAWQAFCQETMKTAPATPDSALASRMGLRMGSVTGAMIGIAGLAALLAVEAARTARVHHETAERVLADYAALGAEGVANRLQVFLSTRLYPILAAVTIPPPPARGALVGPLGPAAAAVAGGVSWAGCVCGPGPLRVVTYDSAAHLESDLADSIRAAAGRLPDAAYYGIMRRGGELVVFAPLRGVPARGAVYGLPLERIGAAMERAIEKDPVLPEALTHGASVESGVGVTVTLDGHRLAHRAGADSTYFRASHSLGTMFGDMTVEVRLADALAPTLVIGGLPRSRLPFLVGVMALTLALAVAASVQLRQKERLARLREDFVAGASHELRTPLAQIRLFAETLRLERVRSDDERSRAVTVIEREARRLEHLVENLLHFSRAERGTLRLAPEAVDVGALTREIVAEFTPLAEKAGAGIRVEGNETITAQADPSAWRQIVLNLLDNAVKYGGHGARVTVRLEPDAGFCRLTVADEGPGVAPADRERIWERFWRGDAARSAGITGTGIGLATVRDLVTLHRGACWVEPATPSGARFVVRVPARS
jgi:signal transduction histidine kinase